MWPLLMCLGSLISTDTTQLSSSILPFTVNFGDYFCSFSLVCKQLECKAKSQTLSFPKAFNTLSNAQQHAKRNGPEKWNSVQQIITDISTQGILSHALGRWKGKKEVFSLKWPLESSEQMVDLLSWPLTHFVVGVFHNFLGLCLTFEDPFKNFF